MLARLISLLVTVTIAGGCLNLASQPSSTLRFINLEKGVAT
jgi:hypothetical protein